MTAWCTTNFVSWCTKTPNSAQSHQVAGSGAPSPAHFDGYDISDLIDRVDSAESSEAAEPIEQPDNTEPTESIERTEPRESIERTEPSPPIERTEPTEPIERTEPSPPIDNSEPLLPMHSIDPSDHNDHRDSERGLEVMRPLSRDRSFTRPGQASEAAVFRTAPPPALVGPASLLLRGGASAVVGRPTVARIVSAIARPPRSGSAGRTPDDMMCAGTMPDVYTATVRDISGFAKSLAP